MSAGPVRQGAPSGRIDLGALVRENAAFHGPKEETTSVLPDRDFGGSMDRAVHYVRQLRTTGVPDEGALRMSYRNALQQIELEFRYGNYQRAANRVQVAASLNRALDMLQRNSGKPEDIATLRGAVKTFGGKPFDPPDPPRQLTQNVSAGKMGGMTSSQTAGNPPATGSDGSALKAGNTVTFGDGTRSARVVRVGAPNKEGNPGVVVQTDDGYEHTMRAKGLRAADASTFRLASLHDLRAHKGKQVDLRLAGDEAPTRVQVVSFGKVDGQPAIKVRQKVYDRDARGYVMRERVYKQDQVTGFTVVDTAAEKSIGNPTGGGDARSERSARSIERGLRSGAGRRK